MIHPSLTNPVDPLIYIMGWIIMACLPAMPWAVYDALRDLHAWWRRR